MKNIIRMKCLDLKKETGLSFPLFRKDCTLRTHNMWTEIT